MLDLFQTIDRVGLTAFVRRFFPEETRGRSRVPDLVRQVQD